jgi:Peptidase A4 family
MIDGLRPWSTSLRVRLAATVALSLTAVAITAGSASAATLTAHGQLLHLAPGVRANANQSSNWFGYNQGSLEQGDTLFNSISGNWTVPTATQHTSGQAEASSDWIGIGGGCVDSGCTVTDSTLIQTGTEQDVSSTGAASYSAWYELVPAPSLTISSITVHPGDQMHASISQVASDVDVWDITITDLTTGQSSSTTLPYPSTMSTAEWIEETPLEIGTNAGFAALPNLTTSPFSSGTVNGSAVKLNSSEEMDLIDSNGNVIGAPSAPNSAGSGFDACAWASSCS